MNKPMRTAASKQGLIDMCNYIDSIYPIADMTMIEIGSYAGDSTEIFAQRFKKVYAIDPWVNKVGGITNLVNMIDIYKQFVATIKPYDNIEVIKDFSYNVANRFTDKSVNIIYIDGLHTYEAVLKDTRMYQPKIKDYGFICGHDYTWKFPGVKKAVNELLVKPDMLFKDSSWVKRINCNG